MSGATDLVKNTLSLPGNLIRGPKKRGRPTAAPSPEETAEAEAELAGAQSDVVRRNALRRSSTAGSGADFIARMQQGLDQTPVPETTPVQSGPALTESQSLLLADQERDAAVELRSLESQSSARQRNTRGRNQRIRQLREMLGRG